VYKKDTDGRGRAKVDFGLYSRGGGTTSSDTEPKSAHPKTRNSRKSNKQTKISNRPDTGRNKKEDPTDSIIEQMLIISP